MNINVSSVEIGKRIKEQRKKQNIKQLQLSRMISVETSKLSRIESGKIYPDAITLAKLAQALQCSTDWLLFGLNDITNQAKVLSDVLNKLSVNEQLFVAHVVEYCIEFIHTNTDQDKNEPI